MGGCHVNTQERDIHSNFNESKTYNGKDPKHKNNTNNDKNTNKDDHNDDLLIQAIPKNINNPSQKNSKPTGVGRVGNELEKSIKVLVSLHKK